MKTFHCSACQALVFFENTKCLSCGRLLAFAADRGAMIALEKNESGTWRAIHDGETEDQGGREPREYRLCKNTGHGVCNWTLDARDTGELCRSCRLTRTIPDLTAGGNEAAWAKLEAAKRRLIYAILTLNLPLRSKLEDSAGGLVFEFLSDAAGPKGDQSRVLTGHDNGLITINVAEADDIYRETERLRHGEPYRTVLGHFRHEIGHYYWDCLVASDKMVEEFRRVFGDERADYQQSLEKHYKEGPPENWASQYISAYASSHPWEDWAECWAHVMHMVDALETAHFVGLSIQPRRPDEPALSVPSKPPQARVGDVDELIHEWSALTYVLNNLTRGLGLPDAYPFVLSASVIEKLRFTCRCMSTAAAASAAARSVQGIE